MNVPIVVKMYYINDIVNFPQLVSIILIITTYLFLFGQYLRVSELNLQLTFQIGHITDIGIMDMKMDLHTAVRINSSKDSLRKCIPPPLEKNSFNPFPLDHESNWLAVFSKKMKNLIQLEGLVSRETNEKINNAVSWFLGFIMFILGLILIIKCVYTIFKVQTEEERQEARRRKFERTAHVVNS